MQITDLTSPNELGLLQYWYTQSVTMDGPQGYGVYAQEVWAPKLVGRQADAQIEIRAEIGEPPRLGMATPEPGLAWLVWGVLVCGVAAVKWGRR